MKTSLVIPSTNLHFRNIDCILSHYAEGTVKPDEVIVSISNAHLVDDYKIKDIKDKFKNTFENFELIEHNTKMVQGPNRDSATMRASNRIITSSDSDDIPHPQRIEVIKYFFENHDIVHLNHGLQYEKSFDSIRLEDIQYMKHEEVFAHHFPNYKKTTSNKRPNPHHLGFMAPYGGNLVWNITGGSVSILKETLKDVRWKHQEEVAWDYDFCLDVLFYFNKSMLIDSPLIWYNNINSIEWAC
jgi:hypothetical protein